MYKGKVEAAVEIAEQVVNIVEKVAEETEKIAEDVGDHLPEGGRLKKAIIFVENVARETAKDAHLAEHLIDKVQIIIPTFSFQFDLLLLLSILQC